MTFKQTPVKYWFSKRSDNDSIFGFKETSEMRAIVAKEENLFKEEVKPVLTDVDRNRAGQLFFIFDISIFTERQSRKTPVYLIHT